MKLVRWGTPGTERAGMVDAGGRIRDLSGSVSALGGAMLSPESLAGLRSIDPLSLPAVPEGTRIGPCVDQVSKIVCVGLNYSDHAAETGSTVPPEPILFMKATSAICGPNDNVLLPRGSRKTDWEVELGVVIGSVARYVDEADAFDYVAGYCVVNDISEREYQLERRGSWDKGKGCDTFAPIGPWLVTRDEIANPQDLSMFLEVDDRRFQDGSTRTMVYPVRHLVAYISSFMTLLPGDIIATGTPAGVGMGQKPPLFLRAGQRVRAGIAGLGEQSQLVTAAPA